MRSSCDQVITDPYLHSEVSHGSIGTPIVSDQVIEGQVYPSTVAPVTPVTPVQPDNFNARKFDTDGNRILWEEPVPKGATSL